VRVADQLLRAWSVDLAALDAVVGSEDRDLIRKVTRKSERVADIRQMVEGDSTLEELLDDVIAGCPRTDDAYRYRRIAELVLDRVGTKLKQEVTKSGRGWQFLAPAWKRWKLPAIAKAWTAVSPWPWPPWKTPRVEWPRLLTVRKRDLRTLDRDLAAYSSDVVKELGVPTQVPRFGEGEWSLEDLAVECAHLVAAMHAWVLGAQRAKRDLAIWHDGDA
jgi:hypothetical protein